MLNPAIMMKMMNARNRFTQNHPRFTAFLNAAFSGGIEEGTVIEITVTKPGQEAITSNIRVMREDMELIEALKEIGRE